MYVVVVNARNPFQEELLEEPSNDSIIGRVPKALNIEY